MAKILVAYQISDNPKDFPFQMPEKGKVIDWCFCEEGKEYILEDDHLCQLPTS